MIKYVSRYVIYTSHPPNNQPTNELGPNCPWSGGTWISYRWQLVLANGGMFPLGPWVVELVSTQNSMTTTTASRLVPGEAPKSSNNSKIKESTILQTSNDQTKHTYTTSIYLL